MERASMTAYPWPLAFPINTAKAAAVQEFMACPPEREAALLAIIRRPAGVVTDRAKQGDLPL